MKRVIIHYPYIPSYRVPVFNELSKNLDVIYLSALSSPDKTIKSDNVNWKFKHHETNLKQFSLFGKKYDYETKVFRHLWKYRKEASHYIVLSNPNILTSWLYSILAKILGYKVVFWGHGLLKEDAGVKALIRKVYYSLADQFLLYGNRGKELLINAGISSSKIKVIYNSLDYEQQKKYRLSLEGKKNDLRLRMGFNPDDVILVCMGRLVTKLKIDKLISLLGQKKDLFSNYKLIVIGDGPERKRLEELVREYKIEGKVKFIGKLYDEESISNYYMMADASVVMGIVGLAAMHSLAYGIPLITHSNLDEHCPEVEAIINKETGYFFEQDNEQSLIETLLYLNRAQDLKKIKQNCIDIIEEYYTPQKQSFFIKSALYEKKN
ncbi:TPA: glycosyltransferase family 4 protein [Citrobacter sedlakii]